MKIVYLPIDERPCNIDLVKRIADSSKEIELIIPDKKILGRKKTPANTSLLWEWLYKNVTEADAAVLSIDMLLYGGLLPSRTHYLSFNEGKERIERLKELRRSYPDLPIYASTVIMRTPQYSSSDEEPDYYEDWGRDLFLSSYLKDKQERNGLTDMEHSQLLEIEARLPEIWKKDYEERRAFNLQFNKEIFQLVADGIISYLSIPQDDSSEYGYTAIDQNIVIHTISELELYQNVYMYPGADEVGATLIARAYNEFKNQTPSICPFWSSTLGPQLIPMYEDRPFGESLKAHVLASGCRLVDSPEKAELVLAYNTPGHVMQESWEQATKDVTYSSFRNILYFVKQIASFISEGKKVIIADAAFANGGDYELIKLLDKKHILDQLISYKGWNTNCNTLGSTISQGVIGLNGITEIVKENIQYHLIDDYFYQAEIRMEMTADFLLKNGLTYFDLKNSAKIVNNERNYRLLNRYHQVIQNSFKENQLDQITTFAPWNRMFECGLILNHKSEV